MIDRIPAPWIQRFRALGALKHPDVKAVVLVGGCVRDMMLEREPFDWDIMVEGDIGPVLQTGEYLFKTVKTVRHAAFMTATLHFPDGTFLDVVTARTETYPKPAALPKVTKASILDDFKRRDFTVNALALHLSPDKWGELVDPFNGKADVEKGVIRVLHDLSFVDDPTRIYRAARYAGRYGWAVEPHTDALVREAVRGGRPALLSPARRRNELIHLLNEPDPAPALKLLWDWGVWRFWSPAFQWSFEIGAAVSGPADDPVARRLAILSGSNREAALKDLKALSFPRALLQKIASI